MKLYPSMKQRCVRGVEEIFTWFLKLNYFIWSALKKGCSLGTKPWTLHACRFVNLFPAFEFLCTQNSPPFDIILKKCQNTVTHAIVLSRIACRKSCILKRYINIAALPIRIYQNLHHLSHYFIVYDNLHIYVYCHFVLSPPLAASSLKQWTTTYQFLLAKPQDCVLQLILPHFTFFQLLRSQNWFSELGPI
jgi:hypothetical protein